MKKRLTAMLFVFAFVFTSVIGRCAYVAFSSVYEVSDTYNSYTLIIGKLQPYIFDRAGNPLNNNTKTNIAIIRPNEKCLRELNKLFSSSEIAEITKELSQGYPIIKETDKRVDTDYIQFTERINQNSSNMLCPHLLDSKYGGLESYLGDEIGSLYVNFPVDAMGRLLAGGQVEIVNNNYDSRDGVIISIDSEIQKICEKASESIPKGAVVVMDSETSQILASVSRGDDYINRALSGYAVGSVFKLIVCAAAIENGISPLYSCTSSIKVYDTEFSCYKKHSHGLQNMKTALANSCNCYFVNLALKLGADRIYTTAKEFGFGEEFELFQGWKISSGSFPDLNSLSSKGQLALLGFGQGLLTDSPVHFASAVSCIANGGSYHLPTLSLEDTKENRIIKESTAKKICEYMRYVVSNGTGNAADYKGKTAGKTATAQSGIYTNGREILNTWFAGFYSDGKKNYTIVVMREDGNSGAGDCCPVFRSIVEKIADM